MFISAILLRVFLWRITAAASSGLSIRCRLLSLQRKGLAAAQQTTGPHQVSSSGLFNNKKKLSTIAFTVYGNGFDHMSLCLDVNLQLLWKASKLAARVGSTITTVACWTGVVKQRLFKVDSFDCVQIQGPHPLEDCVLSELGNSHRVRKLISALSKWIDNVCVCCVWIGWTVNLQRGVKVSSCLYVHLMSLDYIIASPVVCLSLNLTHTSLALSLFLSLSLSQSELSSQCGEEI